MPKNNLFARYADTIRSLADSDLAGGGLPNELLMERSSDWSTWYAPFDHVNEGAKIVIVGITPGHQQATNALFKARDVLQAGGSDDEAKAKAKVFASFSGAMRSNLTEMLDHVGINQKLGIATSMDLFGDRSDLAHFTSALRYPVFFRETNYGGSPSMVSTAFLRKQLEDWFGSECQQLPDALYIPLGPKVSEALSCLSKQGLLKPEQILDGLPHPSGANGERIAYFMGKKPKEALSTKTNAALIDRAKSSIFEKLQSLSAAVTEPEAPISLKNL